MARKSRALPAIVRRGLAALRVGKGPTEPQARHLRAWGADRTAGKTEAQRRLYANWRARLRRADARQLPQRETAVAKAKRLQRALIKSGENPDDIRVYFRPDRGGSLERRYTVSSWGRFMERDEYRSARTRALASGTFVLALQREDGSRGKEIKDLLKGEI